MSSTTSEEMTILPSSSSTSGVSVSNTITPPPSYTTTTPTMSTFLSKVKPHDQDIELAAPARPEYETSDERLSRYRIELNTAKENLSDSEHALRKQKIEVDAQRRGVRLVEKLIAKEQWRRGPPFRMVCSEICLFLGRFLTFTIVIAPLLGSLMFAMHVINHYSNHCHQTNPKLVRAHTNWMAQGAASVITLIVSASVIIPSVHTRYGSSKLFVAGFLVFMSGFCMLVTMGFAMIPVDAWLGESLPVKDLLTGISCAQVSTESSRPSS